MPPPSHTSQTLAQPPPSPPPPPHSHSQRRRRRERNVVASVLLTLSFHVAALFFGVALLLLLALTLGGAGLVLLCLCSGSSRSVRVLVASLWRAELHINRLGVDDAKRENDADAAAAPEAPASASAAAFSAMTTAAASSSSSTTATASSASGRSRRPQHQTHQHQQQQRGREVTPSVMVLSLLYFLLFKWLFNIAFSAIPLAFWSIAVAQFVVTDGEQLDGVVLKFSGDATQYFVGVAVGFLAHQISLTSAVGSVFVSEKMAGFLFEEATRAEDPEYAPLLHWTAAGQSELPTPAYQYHSAFAAHSVFEPPHSHDEHQQRRPPVLATQIMPESYQNSLSTRRDNRPRLDGSATPFDPRTARAGASIAENRAPAASAGAGRGNGVPPALPVSGAMPYPSMPPFGTGMSDYEAAYRDQTEERVVDCCMFKVAGAVEVVAVAAVVAVAEEADVAVDVETSRDPRSSEWLYKMKWGRHGLKRTKSFDSLQLSTEQENLPPHMRMYEVLDLSPSGPPPHPAFSTRSERVSRSGAEAPMARVADDLTGEDVFDPRYRPAVSRLPMRKTNSDEGRYPAPKEPVAREYREQTDRIKERAQRLRELAQLEEEKGERRHPQSPTSYLREREVYAKDRDFYHDAIIQAAQDGIEKTKLEELELAASSDAPTSTGPYQAAASDVIDLEIRGQFGSLPQTFEDNSYLDAFRPPGQSSTETITTLNDTPMYRGGWESTPEYNPFSPPVSPTSTSNGSFLVNTASYDPYSPTNSVQHDDDFPSDQLPQVYRSIRYTGPPAMANSRFSEFDDVPGRRDKVHFNAFAPPSVAPSPKPFNYTVWAFLLNQRDEMRERAEAFDPSGRKLSVDTKLDIRRGALVHVTLEAPEGFRILNGATQGFSWEGKVCNAAFAVQCTDGAAFGSVMFKASIVVGTEVAILRSYVSVSSKNLEPADLEAQMLTSKLEVLEKAYQEIPYKALEMKELVGVGHFGDAYRATYNGQDVVVKTIRASEFGETSDQIVQEFQHEAAVLNMFGHHPCVVPFVGASTDIRFPLSIVTAYLPYGSLEDNLRGRSSAVGGEVFSLRQKTAMLKDAAAGLLNIHEGGFIHRDIAARNCLVDDDLRVKICDFGLCRRVSAAGGTLMKDGVGPVKYMAPESLLPPHLFSYESDSYMFGVLMWETFTMSSPFASLSPLEAVLKVMNGERLAVPNDLPETLRSLMETCFHDSPTQRPSMVEIMATLDELSAPTRARNASGSQAVGGAATVAAAASASLSSATQLRRDRSSIWV